MEKRQGLSDIASRLQNLFGLQEQAREVVAFVTQATGCKRACLLFLTADARDFTVRSFLPNSKANPFSGLRLGQRHAIVRYLRREKKIASERLTALPDSSPLRGRKPSTVKLDGAKLLIPLISRRRLVGILVLGEKRTGDYTPEDHHLLKSVAELVATGMEKEYLREQLVLRSEELSVINRSSTIIASSLDIQRIFDRFIKELRRIVDIDWAAITLIGNGDLWLLALFSEIGSAWRVGERMPIKGTGTEWVASHGKAAVESDLAQQSRFVTAESHIEHGIRSIAYLPLIASGGAIGSLVVASRHPNAYNRHQIVLLKELTSQIIMPIENSQLYAEVVEKVRIDEMTGLFNRRSFDEVMASETSRYSRYGGVFSLIMLDLDYFKKVNDTYGHLAGDAVLRQIGNVIRQAIRASDQAFRYGGDEFAILLPNTPPLAVGKVAERIRRQIASRTADLIPVTASLGIASCPTHGAEANDIIAAADAALYQAKGKGRNQSLSAPEPEPPPSESPPEESGAKSAQ